MVNDIDTQVVSIVRRFNNAFKTVTGQNEVRKMLRSILWLKYKIKDNAVFEKAYGYVEMYYNSGIDGPNTDFTISSIGNQESKHHHIISYGVEEDNGATLRAAEDSN